MSDEEGLGRGQKRGGGQPGPEEFHLLTDQLQVERDGLGRVLSAVARGVGAMPLRLTVIRAGTEATGAQCGVELHSEGDLLAHADARVDPLRELASFEIAAGESRVSWMADFSAYEERHLVPISGEVNGLELAGVMDPRSGASSVQLTLEDWIEPSAVTQLRRFAPIFREMDLDAREERADFEDTISHTIHNSRWSTIGRAACWGLGGMAAGVCCIAAPGIGCVVALGLFGGASSICSDKIGPVLDRKTR